jgi:Phosphotransferase enzyme family
VRSSPLELLLPDGAADGTLVLGDDCPQALAPERVDGEPPDKTVDLVILAPSESQHTDAGWSQAAAGVAASRLSPEGLAYVVPGGARRLRRALAGAGLSHAATLLHVPDVAAPRYLVPVGSEAERWALAGGITVRRGKRLLARCIGSQGRAALGPTAAIHRRAPGTPVAAWLHRLGGDQPPGSTMVALPQGSGAGAILFRFAADRHEPDAVAKVTPGADDELEALRRIAPAAGDAGAHVPVVLASGRLASSPFVLESVVGGRAAAGLVAASSRETHELQGRLGDWLAHWNRACARTRPIGQDDVERLVLAPAFRAGVDGSYLDFLRSLGARAIGQSCPFVPTHGDLTLANVLVEGEELGIVDWEHASAESLPLTDLLYAGVDAVAARRRYADRPAAFTSCFAHDGDDAVSLERLRQRSAAGLGLDEVVQTLCFHTCWLHHAANEATRSNDSTPGPFVTILQTIASTPGSFGVPLTRP